MKTVEVNVLGGKLTVEIDDANVDGGNYDAPTITPVVSSTLGSPTQETVIPIQVTFNYGVINFTLEDVVITGGSGQNFVAESSTVYTFEVVPYTNNETITIAVPGGIASEAVNSDPASQFSIIHNSEDNVAPIVSNATLSASAITPSGFVAQFAKATDNNTNQQNLVYRLYVSDQNNLTGDVNLVEANGSLMEVGTDVTSLQASGLSPSTPYWFNVIVSDGSGNKTVYSPGTAQTAVAGTISIMPFGDSLTNDSRGRVEFWNQMVASGYTIDFVGSQSQGNATGDPDHEGVGGRTIAQGASVINGLLSTYDPDYVLMLLGTNDFAWYFAQPNGATEAQVAQTIAQDHQALTQQILDNSPSAVTVVVSTVPKMMPKTVGQLDGDRDVVRAELNVLIREYVSDMQSQGLNVVLSDVDQNIILAEDVSQNIDDGVHLTSTGYVKLGQAYHGAMLSVLAPVDTTPPVVGDSVLSFSNVGSNGFQVNFSKASDNLTSSANLLYRLYTSELNNIGTVTLAESNGVLRATGTDISSLMTGALQPGTDYYANIIVVDQSNNRTAYAQRMVTTTQQDTTPPTVSNPALTVANLGASSFVLNFAGAQDAVSSQSELIYRAYVSELDNINTPALALQNGTAKQVGTGVTSLSCSGLNQATTYYYMVTVEDEAGNVAGYTSGNTTTGSVTATEFVSASGTDFAVNSAVMKFYGTNAYYGPTYMKINPGLMGDILDEMQTLGINLVRAWGFYDGPPQFTGDISLQPDAGVYSSDFQYLDQFIAECKTRGIYVQLSFVNFWSQLGGIEIYNGWAGSLDPSNFQTRMREFINGATQQQLFRDYIAYVLNRVNSVTGIAYKDEPYIFAWEAGNELRNPIDYSSPAGLEIGDELADWYQDIGSYIKSIDPNHMFTTGEEGFDEGQGGNNTDYQASSYSNTYVLRAQNGTSYMKNTAVPAVDFGQFHWYPDVFGLEDAFDSADPLVVADAEQDQDVYMTDHYNIAFALGKPCQVGEYGIVDWDSTDNWARKTLGYLHYYSVLETRGIQSSLLWQYLAFGLKQGEFGGNIVYPGGREDLELYNDYQAHLDRIFGTADVIAPTVPVDDALTYSNVATNSMTVNFNKATDNETAQASLKYRLYMSELNNIDTVENAVLNGQMMAEGFDVTSLNATGLAQNTLYTFNVVVLDSAGNASIYTMGSQSTTNPDVTAPTLPADTTITPSAEAVDGFTLTWNQSTDDITSGANIQYTPYVSLSNNISTVVDAEANGTAQPAVTGAGTTVLSGLTADTTYYFNIVVEDQAGNKAIYTAGTTATLVNNIPTINMAHAMATDLKAYWDFYEGSGSVVNDLVGANDMLLDYTYPTTPAPWVTFDGHTCVEFAEGTAHVGAVPDGVDLQPSTTGPGLTWAMIFSYNESGSSNSSIWDGGGNPNGVSIIQRQWNDEFSFRIGSPSQAVDIPIKNDNLLHTLMFTVDTSDPVTWVLRVYLDGVEIGTGYNLAAGGSFNNHDTHFWVGGNFGWVSPEVRANWTTRFRKMAHWHRPLTAQEALDWHNNPDLMLN